MKHGKNMAIAEFFLKHLPLFMFWMVLAHHVKPGGNNYVFYEGKYPAN
jgi:hypothetical protein